MALVLNGSGSITGLSAGGLPDGSVTADDIASTLDLSGKTVTLAAGGTGYGKVLQVVTNTTYGLKTSTTNTFVDTGLSASITPSSTSSKILIFVCNYENYTATTTGGIKWKLLRNSIDIGNFGNTTLGYHQDSSNNYFNVQMQWMDSPATTSSVTYKTQFCSSYFGEAVTIMPDSTYSVITIMEIAA